MKKPISKVKPTWHCAECDRHYLTKKSAKNCHDGFEEKIYLCITCNKSYAYKADAESCSHIFHIQMRNR